MRVIWSAVWTAALVAWKSSAVWAWNGSEHAAVSSAAYRHACEDIKRSVPGTDARFVLACGPGNVERLARLFGQAVEIAGDHLQSPDDFFTSMGDIDAVNIATYGFLALVNSGHFHPHAPRNWLRYHREALDALAGPTRPMGLSAIGAFDRQLFTEAFAAHFLEDSFASGHMGFNRSSSSAAASKGFHDIWNHNGRYVRDQTGHCWRTYGDGYLQDPPSHDREVWTRVEEAARSSVIDFLMVFVTGQRDGAREMDAWMRIPVEGAPEPLALVSQTEIENNSAPPISQSCVKTNPTAGVSNPAHIRTAVDGWASGEYQSSASRVRWGLDAVLSYSTDSLLVHRLEAGLGAGAEQTVSQGGGSAFAADARLGAFWGPTVFGYHGLFRSEVGTTGVLFWVSDRGLQPDLRAEYRLTIEAADWVIRINAGPSWEVRTGTLGAVLEIGFNRWWRWIDGGGLAE